MSAYHLWKIDLYPLCTDAKQKCLYVNNEKSFFFGSFFFEFLPTWYSPLHNRTNLDLNR